jgi:hypothetical protein
MDENKRHMKQAHCGILFGSNSGVTTILSTIYLGLDLLLIWLLVIIRRPFT